MPNILLIMTDDQGYGDLASHGNPLIQTPVQDRLAAESVEFTRFYVSPLCAPTRASLLTGRYNIRTGTHGVTAGKETMWAEETILAEVLQSAGYRTGIFGKWHLGEHYPYVPHAQGFDEFVGFRTGHWIEYFDTQLERNGKTFRSEGYMADTLTDEALRFMEANQDRSFFLYVPYNPPHSPFQVPDEYFDLYEGKGLDPRTQSAYAMVTNLDDNIGRILARLEELELSDDTIVVFLSDNGPNGTRFNGGLRGTKGSVYEGGTRVPFFIRWPRGFQGGRKISTIAAHIDLYPTLLELVGVPNPGALPLDGLSLVPLLEGDGQDWPDRKLYTHREHARDPWPLYPGAVRTERFNLVNGTELYEITVDPGEQNDVASRYPEVADELRAAYEQWYEAASRERGYKRLPIPVGYEEENPVTLTAPQAYLEGSVEFAPGPGWAHDWIKGWTDPASRVHWKIRVVRAGTYAVSLHYLCRPEDVGARIRVTVGGKQLEATVTEPTSMEPYPHPDRVPRREAPEMDWGTLPFGEVELAEGEMELSVEALTRPGKAALELKRAVLKRLN